jgi:hypothetical protein
MEFCDGGWGRMRSRSFPVLKGGLVSQKPREGSLWSTPAINDWTRDQPTGYAARLPSVVCGCAGVIRLGASLENHWAVAP